MPLASFNLFPQLPAELRGLIWDAAADTENDGIVEVYFDRQPECRTRAANGARHIIWQYRCYNKNPSLHLVNLESREQYLLSHPDILRLNQGQLIYFNGARDTVYFDSESFSISSTMSRDIEFNSRTRHKHLDPDLLLFTD
jgi:hypothetical protein